MKTYLEFLNVEEWSFNEVARLLSTEENTLHFIDPILQRKAFTSQGFKDLIFLLADEEEWDTCSSWYVYPGDVRWNKLFEWLEAKQWAWRDGLRKMINNGPDFLVFNALLKRTECAIRPGVSDRFDVTLSYATDDRYNIEDFLEFDLLQTFISGTAKEIFPKLRSCKNPECEKWFVYNRPKQLFCCSKCRLDYHNSRADKAKKAAMARKKRADGLWQ